MNKENEPLRVLLLFTIMNRGGAETMVMNYYRNIDRTKIQFDFLVHRQEKGAFEEEIVALGGKIYRICPIAPQNYFTYKKNIKAFFEQHKEYKIIHSHMSELGYWAFKEAKRQGVPVRICHAHNFPSFTNLDIKEKIKWIPRLYFRDKIRSISTEMFVCGNEAGKWLFGTRNEPEFVLMNNAIETSKFQYNLEIRNQYRKELGISENFVVGHVGRFNHQKNHDFLIDIFDQIHKQNSKSKLLLIGAGNLMTKVKNKVEQLGLTDSVLFLGNRSDVNNLLQAFDVFLFPSFFEGLPVTVIEAQATGLKCIISDQITEEVEITPNVTFVSLSKTSSEWAQTVLKYLSYDRLEIRQSIDSAGYDIKSKANWLKEFYLNSIK